MRVVFVNKALRLMHGCFFSNGPMEKCVGDIELMNAPIKLNSERELMYKLNVLASARIICNIMVCKCEIEPTSNCILEMSI
jgi:hypothetical protein